MYFLSFLAFFRTLKANKSSIKRANQSLENGLETLLKRANSFSLSINKALKSNAIRFKIKKKEPISQGTVENVVDLNEYKKSRDRAV